MSNPKVLGRSFGEKPETADARASTVSGPQISISYISGAIGAVHVEVFTSTDDEDRGGIVLRITVEDQASSFVPVAKNIANGVELHLAGDAEGASLVRALRGALAALPKV